MNYLLLKPPPSISEWKPDIYYELNAIVSYLGYKYQCVLVPNINNIPNEQPEYWKNLGQIPLEPVEEDYIPQLYRPFNNSNVLPGKITFIWLLDTLLDNVEYNFQLAKDSEFKDIITEQNQILNNYSIDLKYGTYYWRVRISYNRKFYNWSEVFKFNVTLTSDDQEDEQNEINYFDIIEDYEGGLYLIQKGKSYKINYAKGKGEIKLNKYDLQEYDYYKKLNSVSFDIAGWGKALNKYFASSARNIKKVYNKLDDRIPVKTIELDFEFTGTLYGLEIDLEVFNGEQL